MLKAFRLKRPHIVLCRYHASSGRVIPIHTSVGPFRAQCAVRAYFLHGCCTHQNWLVRSISMGSSPTSVTDPATEGCCWLWPRSRGLVSSSLLMEPSPTAAHPTRPSLLSVSASQLANFADKEEALASSTTVIQRASATIEKSLSV